MPCGRIREFLNGMISMRLLAGTSLCIDAWESSVLPTDSASLNGKNGIEIGGLSELFRRWYQPVPIYGVVGSLDIAYSPTDNMGFPIRTV